MTVEQLRDFRRKVPFSPFTIHMTDGHEFVIRNPDDLFIHPDWNADAMVLHPRGRFSFIYVRNIASVSGEGHWPKLKRRGKGKNSSDD